MIRHRLSTLLLLGVLAFTSFSCSKQASRQPMEVVSRLCQHVRNRPKIVVDTNQAEIVWSDGAIMEFGTNFPVGLQQIISRPTHYTDIRRFVKELNAGNPAEWKNASIAPYKGGRCYTIGAADGSVRTSVDSVYLEYLCERYPTASIRIKGKFDPILFQVEGEVRAFVMPVKL